MPPFLIRFFVPVLGALVLSGCNMASRSKGVFADEASIAAPPSMKDATPSEPAKPTPRTRTSAARKPAPASEQTTSTEADPEAVKPVLSPSGRAGAGFRF